MAFNITNLAKEKFSNTRGTAYSLRPATPEDAEFVDQLTYTTMKDYVAKSWPETEKQDAYFERNKLGDDWQKTLIVEVDIRGDLLPVGRVTAHETKSTVNGVERKVIDLSELHVLPEWQGNGIGSAVIKTIKAAALKEDPQLPVELIVLAVNEAHNLYEREGFVIFADGNNGSPNELRHHMVWNDPATDQAYAEYDARPDV